MTILVDDAVRAGSSRYVLRAVRQSRALSVGGIMERVFAHLFTGLVYPQIWEDPEVDLAAMDVRPGHRIVTIASGGCNALSYLVADPGQVEAVDLNPVHVAFNRLKHAGLKALPDHAAFFRFFGAANAAENLETYTSYIRPALDPESRAYWDGRSLLGRRRVSIFVRDLYRHGVLGRFIGLGTAVARLHGVDLRNILAARTLEEQRGIFDAEIAPLFDKPLVRWATAQRSSLFGLGIPPQQYDALAKDGATMGAVLKARVERLACDFPLAGNYFAWQAFGRRYEGTAGSLPPYLRPENFGTMRDRVSRVTVANISYADFLAAKPDASVDRFVLLDAQDWMNDSQLNDLWREITRTAAPGARVIFRTAADERLLPGRVAADLLARWDYLEGRSRVLHARDRSAIYGGFHLYVLKDD
jgi:S-adenosylmethionine-diacylglycerol 3-amino-3-carboxypropyl transferase